jgi:TetR/AcrR family transcriptional regulator, regulator of cefoperazone and chloramphenicol sensitivity
MEHPLLFPRSRAPVERSSEERIRDAALKSFANHGVAATTLRTVAEAAGVSVGLVQHYFGTKAALVAAVDQYVLNVFGDALESMPLPAPPADALAEAGRRLVKLFAEHTDVVDYVGHALVEGGEVGTTIFGGLFAISAAQRDQFEKQNLTRPDLDPVWAALNPLILRIGAVILRPHIERHIPEPFTTLEQLQRWNAAVTSLIRGGQLHGQPGSANGPAPPHERR